MADKVYKLIFTKDDGSEDVVQFTAPQGEPGADGKTPIKGTDYFTEADKQEIAEAAAGMVEVPEATMKPLTFTGAVNATYDGSKAVSVEIPQGGGETEWRLIRTVKIPADEPVTGGVTITTDENGNPFELLEVAIRVKERARISGYSYGLIRANNKFVGEERRNTPMLILIRDIGGLWTAGTMGMGYQDNGALVNWGYNYANHNCLVNDNPTINKLHLGFISCDMEIYGKVRK